MSFVDVGHGTKALWIEHWEVLSVEDTVYGTKITMKTGQVFYTDRPAAEVIELFKTASEDW